MPVPRHVLVVDDEPGVRHFCRRVLGSFVPRVSEAESVAAALHILINDRSVDYVLTDVNLGMRQGWEVVEWLRLHRPKCGLAVMTGRATDAASLRAGTAGVRLIAKPFSVEQLQRLFGGTSGPQAR